MCIPFTFAYAHLSLSPFIHDKRQPHTHLTSTSNAGICQASIIHTQQLPCRLNLSINILAAFDSQSQVSYATRAVPLHKHVPALYVSMSDGWFTYNTVKLV